MNGVSVVGLRVELLRTGDDVVSDVAFDIAAGEVVGLVGESGSGKTTIGTAMLGYARPGTRIVGGHVHVGEIDVLQLEPRALRAVRGKTVAYIPQDPAAALNPALTIGRQLSEMVDVHDRDRGSAPRIRTVLDEVKLPSDARFLARFAHELSGGQQQRVAIAMAFLLGPAVVVLDEPTTGLDVTTQARVLELVRSMCAAHAVAALYISHDLAVIRGLADRVIVAYAGRIVEIGSRADVFERSAHPYTRRLLASMPTITARRAIAAIPGVAPAPGARPVGCSFAPRCSLATATCAREIPPEVEVGAGHRARCLYAASVATTAAEAEATVRRPDGGVGPAATTLLRATGVTAGYGGTTVLRDVDLSLAEGECVAIVGESGSGKTTLARALAGAGVRWQGEIRFGGEQLATNARNRTPGSRRAIQYIFQSPYNSLNPRRTIEKIISMPARHFFGRTESSRSITTRVHRALERVALPTVSLQKYPDELSGGERQRVAIARALVSEPQLLICDEVTSALDVSVQAAIVDLLITLRQSGLTILFITHDLALVAHIAGRVLVMHEGAIVEQGPVRIVLDTPSEPYTQALLAHTPLSEGPLLYAQS